MEDLYKTLQDLCANKGVSGGKMCKDIGISRSFMTELKMGRAKSITLATAKKLADYFGCDMAMFIEDGVEIEEKEITKEQLKFALFNGDDGVTDAMLDEVLKFARYIKSQEDNK